MNTIIQYLTCELGVDKNTAVTLVLTLLIFILGYIITAIATAINKYFNRRNYRKIFKDVLESIATNSGKQATLFEKAAKTADVNNEGDFIFQKTTIVHLDSVDKLEFKDMYNAHITGVENLFVGNKVKAFNKIFARIAMLKQAESKIDESVSHYDARYHEHEQRWNDSIEKIRQLTDKLQTETQGQTLPRTDANYLEGMDRIIFAWQQLPNRTHPPQIKTHYIDALHGHNRAYHNQDFGYKWVILQTDTLLLNAQHNYDNMKVTLAMLSSIFKDNALVFRGSKRVIMKALKMLN